ncbi:MFS transporter [bacterium]|nr:MFS transporter [bacterium]
MESSTHEAQNNGKATRRYTLLSVFLTIFLDLVGFGMFIPILPAIARQLNASNAQAALLSTFFSIGTLLSVMVFGKWSDAIGRRKILVGTILLSMLAQGLTGLTPVLGSYVLLAVIRFVAGIAAGNISVAQAAIADITPLTERSRSMVIIGIAFGAGFAFGPALGALITLFFPENPIVPISIAAVGLNFINLILILLRFKETHARFAPPELKPLIEAAQAGADASGERQSGARQEASKLLARPFIKTIFLMQFIQVFGFVGVETILPLALADAYALNQSSIYRAFLYLGAMVLLINGAVSRPVLKKAGEPLTLNIGQLSLTCGIYLIPWLAPHPGGLYVALSMLSLGSSFANPALSGLVSRLSPHDRQGLALGMAQSLSAGARILGPAFMGLVYDRLHGAPSLYVSSGLLLVVTLIGMAGLRGIDRLNLQQPAPAA